MEPHAWPALADPATRNEIDRRLRGAGRQLLALRDRAKADEPVTGYLTCWEDATAEAILAAGDNPLSVAEQATLALVLLHSMAIPQASGVVPPQGLREAAVFDRARLTDRKGSDGRGLGTTVVDEAVITLVARRLLTHTCGQDRRSTSSAPQPRNASGATC